MTFIKMWIFLNILSSLHYLITACTPSNSGVTKMTAFSGESVLLPCSCTDPLDRPMSISWETNSRTASKDGLYTDISSVFELYSDRIRLFNQTSPGNVSLLLSDLTEDDQGSYVCFLDKTSSFTDVLIKKRKENVRVGVLISVLISGLFLVMASGGATVIYCIHKAQREARMETPEKNEENILDDHNSTYGILERKYNAEEMYGTIGDRPKDV